MSQAEKDKEQRIAENQTLSLRIHQLEKMVRDDENARAAIQAALDAQKEEYGILKVKFQELQKGFLLGQLEDEMKELLLGELEEEKLGSSDVAEAIGEQSAMQKLIQQLKDSRQALVNAQDDMNFWKGKYHGLQDRMTNMQESFQDSINSLELTKDKMQNMVPSEVHVALKKRYQQVLEELSEVRQIANKKRLKPHKTADTFKDRPHDDWKLYGKEEEEEEEEVNPSGGELEMDEVEPMQHMDGGGAGLADLDDKEIEQVPKDFILSVAEQRDKLNETYRNYRRMHNTSIISWVQLKTMTLAEFARLEHDCFSKHSLWALPLMRSEKT